jgi:hypothetical protein
MRRKNEIRTLPWPVATAENPALPPPVPPEDEDTPTTKKPKLLAATRNYTPADGVTTDSPDDTPTDPVTPAASLSSATDSRTARPSWNAEEDAKLTEAVKKFGKHWGEVAELVPERTHSQCRYRWLHSMNPANGGNKCKAPHGWEPEDDVNLVNAVKKHGKDWVAVAKLVPGRTNQQCRHRWLNSLDHANGGNKGNTPPKYWEPEEDANLVKAVKKHGYNWVAVATLVSDRTNQQCRERWVNTLDHTNGGNKGNTPPKYWEPEEDTRLMEAVKKHGKDWVAVAKLVPGRTNQQCRQRWSTVWIQTSPRNTEEEDPDRR